MQYLPEAMDDKQRRRATLDEKLLLFTHTEDRLAQDQQQDDGSLKKLSITGLVVLRVYHNQERHQNVRSFQANFSVKS